MDVVVNGVTDNLGANQLLISQGGYYPNVLTCLGFNSEHFPLAELLRTYHQLDGEWLIASPIHWEATHNDAMIVATGIQLGWTEKESRLWFAEVAQFLKVDGFNLFYHDSETWLLQVGNKPAISSKSVYSMMHQSMMPVLRAMDKTLFWQRLITELQMYLSTHPLNAQRQAQLVFNGLWFWGQGQFKSPLKRKIITDDEVLLALSNDDSQPICRLTSALCFEKHDLLCIKYPELVSMTHLQEKTKKNTIHWYWNNLAYTSHATRWWSRLWR